MTREIMSNVTQDFSDGILTITIDRPDVYNSLSKNLRLELEAAFERAQESDMCAIILLDGPKAFCTGQDLKEHISDLQSGVGVDRAVREYSPMVAELIAINVPVIAAIEGATAGAGWSLALHCDFRIAGPKASFKATFPSIGLAMDCGMSALLPCVVSDARTRGLLFFGKKVLTDEALSLGLITEMMDNPATRVRELAIQFAARPTATLKEIKAPLHRNILAATAAEADTQVHLAVSADHKETVAAFLEKRPPRFVGE